MKVLEAIMKMFDNISLRTTCLLFLEILSASHVELQKKLTSGPKAIETTISKVKINFYFQRQSINDQVKIF